ncbi:MAG: AraC family transcriptional regulator [Roseburia sp.]|nr:AraC family transcriptional regulator [Roseburia sp.]
MNILEYENYKEKVTHGSPQFPYNTYLCSIPLDFPRVPLHWHEEMEIIYVKKGVVTITVDFAQHTVSAGTLALILPGQLHSIEQYQQEHVEYENIIFHPNILISKKTDTCSSDYFSPLLDGQVTVPLLYVPGSTCYDEIAACIDANDNICRTYPAGYELFIKGQLFQLFYLLFNRLCQKEAPKKDSRSLHKLKLVLKYLENHYMDKITIADIAKEAGLSQSHFMKYFKNTMGTSFIDYLNDYRLTMASRLLISSDSSILNIASEVGFENLSYFNRTFKKRFAMTPSAYRKAHCYALCSITAYNNPAPQKKSQ